MNTLKLSMVPNLKNHKCIKNALEKRNSRSKETDGTEVSP